MHPQAAKAWSRVTRRVHTHSHGANSIPGRVGCRLFAGLLRGKVYLLDVCVSTIRNNLKGIFGTMTAVHKYLQAYTIKAGNGEICYIPSARHSGWIYKATEAIWISLFVAPRHSVQHVIITVAKTMEEKLAAGCRGGFGYWATRTLPPGIQTNIIFVWWDSITLHTVCPTSLLWFHFVGWSQRPPTFWCVHSLLLAGLSGRSMGEWGSIK